MGTRVISAALTLKDKNFSSNLKRAKERSDDFGRGVALVGNKIKRFSDNAKSHFKAVSAAAAKVTFTGISLAATGAATAVASSVLDMENSFAMLKAKTGLAGNELKGLESVAKDVFVSGFGESLSSVSSDVALLNNMFKGIGVDELKSLTKNSSTIAEVFGQETGEVGKAIKGMTENFEGLSTSKAADLLTYTFQKTGDYANDVLDTFNEYSVHFSKLGLSAEQFAGILSNSSGAFNLDKVGDAVKEFGIRAIDGSKTTVQGFEAIGFSADEMAAKFGQGGEVAQQAFVATLAGLAAIEDPVERNAAGVNLFGTMWEDLRDDVILSMADSKNAITDFEGSTEKAAEAIHSTFSSRVSQVWRDLKTQLGELANSKGAQDLLGSIADIAEDMVPKITDLANSALDFAGTIKDHWPQIKETAIGIGTAVGTFAAIMGTLKIVSGITTLINGFRTAMSLATAGQWAMNTAMLASPMTWVAVGIAAVVAAGVLLYRNWDTVKEKAGQLWEKTKEVFGGIYDWGMNKIQPVVEFFKSLGDKFNDFKSSITNFKLPDWVNSIGNTIGSAKEKISSGIGKVKDMLPSFDVGTNNVSRDMTANIHRGEMIIPARQSENLRKAGVNIDNIDSLHSATPVTTSNNSTKHNNITIHINGTNASSDQILNDLVPKLKLAISNM